MLPDGRPLPRLIFRHARAEKNLEPSLAPLDFVEWLAGWVGAAIDESWPPQRQRELVGRTARLYRRRGTVGGIAEQVDRKSVV